MDTTASFLFEIVLAVAEHPKFGTDLTVSHVVSILESHATDFVSNQFKLRKRLLSKISTNLKESLRPPKNRKKMQKIVNISL